MNERPDVMKELVETDSRQNHTATGVTGPPGLETPRREGSRPSVKPAPHRLRHYKFFVMLAASVGLVVALTAWRHWTTRTDVVKPAAEPSKTIPDLVVLDESQLRQVSVEPAGMGTITLDRNATGKVGFNEDRLTPVFTPYAGRVLRLLVNKGASVARARRWLSWSPPS